MSAGKIAVAVIFTLGFSGCVSRSTHEQSLNELNAKLSERDSLIANQKNTIEQLQVQTKALDEKLATTVKDRGQLKSTVTELTEAVEDARKRQAEQKARISEFEDLTRRFKKLTDAGTLSVVIRDGKMVVSLGSDILFASGSAKLSEEGIKTVQEVARTLQTIPNRVFQVEGHTDDIPIATAVFPSNWELASARSINVVKSMIEAGLGAARVSAASFADTQPIANNATPEGRKQNRRIAIVVVPDLSTLPWVTTPQ